MTKLHDLKPSKKINLAFFTALAISVSSSAFAGGHPVIDSDLNSKAAKLNQTATNQLNQLKQVKKLTDDQLKTLGDSGVLQDVLNTSASGSFGSDSEFYENIKKFKFDPCAINLCSGGNDLADNRDIEKAIKWTKETFYTSKILNNAETRDLKEVRRRGLSYMTSTGMALATVVHNELSGAGEQASALENIVKSSENLRGDIRANSAILLAAYKIEVEKLAVLSAMLGINAANGMMTTGIYNEEGGTSIPDVFKDEDFASGDFSIRTKVTIPQ